MDLPSFPTRRSSDLGTQPVLGRSFSPDEHEPGHDQVVIISHHLWRDRFGSNPAIIGKSVILNSKSSIVIGVMPPSFRFPSGDVDLWQPLPIAANSSNLGNHKSTSPLEIGRAHV